MNPNNTGTLMDPILYLLIPLALLMGIFFLSAFIHCVVKGQWDDLETPAKRLVEPHTQEQK